MDGSFCITSRDILGEAELADLQAHIDKLQASLKTGEKLPSSRRASNSTICWLPKRR